MAKFVIKKAVSGDGRNYYWWRFIGNNNEIICNSESYWQKASAEHSLSLVKQLAPNAPVEEQ